ncbi:hypothetical protein BDZ89DRAFT_1073913 [Hymenopellis radicata]|nr:hypothetical protein BDZ89DRAFT_1073913 [Hymenopellis radicata]
MAVDRGPGPEYRYSTGAPSPTCRQKLFDFNPPFLQRSESLTPPIPVAPLHFLDRHISESLILKHLKILPSFHDEYFTFHEIFSYERIETADALSIIKIREDGVEFATTQIASSLILHPSQPDCTVTMLMWLNADHAIKPTLVNEKYSSQNLTLHVWDLSPDDFKSLNRRNREMYTRLLAHTTHLASCMVFCTDGLPVMEDMARLDAIDVFPWRLDSHYSGTSSTQAPPPDAPDPLWTLPTTGGPRRSRRVRIRVSSQHATSRDIGLVDRSTEKADGYVPQCEDYIQKAWVAAVKTDASLIIFDCGNFVRIGIRHRELQTLFLSNLIDICSCKDPSYGELWTALHIAVASDASAPTNRSKRRKLDDAAVQVLDEEMTKYIASFPALAVFFGSVTSTRLLLFFSSERNLTAGLDTSQRTISASSRISHWSSSFHPQGSFQRSQHSAPKARAARLPTFTRCRCGGIPSVLGFRENPDANLCVLMLSDAGLPLGRRMDSDRKVDLSPQAQESLRSILGSIHEAGILHRDVRSWNIMEDASGRVRFTDFDRASFHAKEADYVAERARLDKFIGGEYVDDDRVIGADDLASTQRR